MKNAALLPRLIRLEAVLDGALELAVPNAAAVRAATRIKSRSLTKEAWTERFRGKRIQYKAPLEKLVASAAKSPQGHVAVVPFDKGHSVAKDVLINRGVRGHRFSLTSGYKTNRQPFVDHPEGMRIARRANQVSKQTIEGGSPWQRDRLHSSHLVPKPKPKPKKRGKKPAA